jgi:hypothetical protein
MPVCERIVTLRRPASEVGWHPPGPLSPARASVPALRARMTTAPGGTPRGRWALRRIVSPTMTAGKAEDQIRPSGILVGALPVMPVAIRLARAPRSTDGEPVRWAQDLRPPYCRGIG